MSQPGTITVSSQHGTTTAGFPPRAGAAGSPAPATPETASRSAEIEAELRRAVPLLLGLDGQKMSKSRGNTIALAATEDETARLIKGARTDMRRHISYEPAGRPEVANLVLMAAMCQRRPPAAVAAEIGSGGAARLRAVVTQAVNEHLRPIRARRRELAADRPYLRAVLRRGNDRAVALAEDTLNSVRELMRMTY